MRRAILSAFLCALVACRPTDLPTQVIVLVDGSKSLPEEARVSMIDKVREVATTIRRGDELIIIPISGFAAVETPNHILRFRLKLKREPYDADRLRFADEVGVAAKDLLAGMISAPSKSTDILGAFEFAIQELEKPSEFQRQIVCLSDFLQDDRQFVFPKDARLSNVAVAKRAAAQLAKPFSGRISGVSTFLGVVQSTESGRLSQPRRDAVKQFWMEYLTAQGARVTWKDDGLGQIEKFLRQRSAEDKQQ